MKVVNIKINKIESNKISSYSKLKLEKTKNGFFSKYKIESKLAKSKNSNTSNHIAGVLGFFNPKTRLAVPKLRLLFTKVLMLNHFESDYYICIKLDISNYTIRGILS